MSSSPGLLATLVRRLTAPLRALVRRLRYARTDGASGSMIYGWTEPLDGPWVLEVHLDADRVDLETARAFVARQTLPELRVLGLVDGKGSSDASPEQPEAKPRREAWRLGPTAEGWHEAPSRFVWTHQGDARSLLTIEPTFLEAAATVLLAENLSAVCLQGPGPGSESSQDRELPSAAEDVFAPPFRARLVVATTSDPAPADLPIKFIGVGGLAGNDSGVSRRRRGPYLWSHDPGPRAVVRLRDAARTPRLPPDPAERRPSLLVTAPFFARGGAEHTLLETLRVLAPRYRIAWATLAPHVAARGDRRGEFAAVAPRLLSLGDLVHPAAMPGLLRSLLDSTGADCWYNANGTTLFYEFAPSIAAVRPALRIVDHLYDHRVGYIDRYDPTLLDTVDACIAENHPIADALEAEHGWPRRRAPVVWPCGRPRDELPTGEERLRLRHALRAKLGIADGEVVVFTAARLHAQKRPLDLAELALRLRGDAGIRFVLAGGGGLEAEVTTAIDDATLRGARIVHLGLRRDIPRLLCAVDVGCLVSAYEGLPVFLLECLQMGLPFIGTNVGDLGRVLRDTGAGPVVDTPGDLDALEAAVRSLLDPARRAEHARKALAAGATFDVEACAARYAAVLETEALETGDSNDKALR
ncbi:MAG: glycosyltransferase family 4 protein [Acidobacteriota bacterium]